VADITRETFDKTKNYGRVVIQKGEPVVDNEFNEQSDILMSQTMEVGRSTHQEAFRATEGKGWLAFAEGSDWLVYPSSTTELSVTAGDLYVDGFQLTLDADYNLMTTGGLSITLPTVADVYGLVYMDVVLAEKDSTDDPNIATPQLGETSVRRAYQVTFGFSTSNVSFAAAKSALSTLSGTEPRLWKGNQGRVFLARFFLASGAATITTESLVDMRQPTPAGTCFQAHRFVKTLRANSGDGSTVADGAITWMNNKLQIGRYPGGAATETQNILAGLVLLTPSAPDVHHSKRSTVDTVDQTNSWSLADKEALGFRARDLALFNKKDLVTSPRRLMHDTTPALASPSAVAVLRVTTLTVVSVDSFEPGGGSFILCTRIGNDLVWFNGQVTRGNSGTNNAAFVELGDQPSPFKAVLGKSGSYHAGPSASGVNSSLEWALNHSIHDSASGVIKTSTEVRDLRFFLRPDTYVFSQGNHSYGVDEDSTEVIELVGDNAENTTIQPTPPANGGRSTSVKGALTLSAKVVILRNLYFSGSGTAGTNDPGYDVVINAQKVIIENCRFQRGARIKAGNVTVRNCEFLGSIGTNATLYWPTQTTGEAPALLRLVAPGTTTRSLTWLVENNDFYGDLPLGCCAMVAVGSNHSVSAQHTTTILNNRFRYRQAAADSTIPAVAITDSWGRVSIKGNDFRGSSGIVKAGNGASGAFPFDGLYDGCPLYKYGNGSSNAHIMATAYVSMAHGRRQGTNTEISGNTFDMTKVGVHTGGSARYAMWGGVIGFSNDNTMGTSGAESVFFGIRIHDNTFDMYSENDKFDPGNTNDHPATWGVYFSRSVQDTSAVSSYKLKDIHICNNGFNWYHPDGSSEIHKHWRSVLPGDVSAWAGTGKLTDQPALVSVVLKNGVNGITMGTSDGVIIDGNRMMQDQERGGGWSITAITLAMETAAPYYAWMSIIVDNEQWPYVQAAPTADADGYLDVASPACDSGCVIVNNDIALPVYHPDAGTAYLIAGIELHGVYRGRVHNNQCILAGAGGGLACAGVYMLTTLRCHASGNTVLADVGVSGPANNYASDNICDQCATPLGGALVTTFTGATSNFSLGGTILGLQEDVKTMDLEALSPHALQATLLLVLVIQAVRVTAERLVPSLPSSEVWRKAVLPLFPIVLSLVGAFYVPLLADPGLTSTADKVKYAIAVGALAGQGFEVVKGLIVQLVKRLTGVDISPYLVAQVPEDKKEKPLCRIVCTPSGSRASVTPTSTGASTPSRSLSSRTATRRTCRRTSTSRTSARTLSARTRHSAARAILVVCSTEQTSRSRL